ncbi:hypothetical protein [Streptomyces sp. NPDC048002]|uniref:hypothetical protein n=1 Tax=Streptomyces sp. NPDC048002 TaxID=3154344 RepID=UPI0033CA63C1
MASHGAGENDVDYEYRFDLPSGWFDLTLEHCHYSDAVILAGSVMKGFNLLELDVSRRDLLRDLTDRALILNSDAPIFAAACYAPNGNGLANLKVDTYGEEGVPRPAPEEVVPMLLKWSNREVASEPDIKYLDLAAGPAVRVQVMLKAKRRLGFGRQLSECVDYAVFPPGVNHLVVVNTRWRSMERTDELSRCTDEFVAAMRRVPVDINGDEVASPNE